MTKKQLQHFMKLPYRMNLAYDDESEAWIVRYPDLPGCIAHGATPEEAIAEGEEAKVLWIESALDENQNVPEPQAEPIYSGKLVLRLPKSLHEAAVESADREGISLNSYLVQLVSEGVQRSGLKNLYGLIEGKLQKFFRGIDFQDDAANYEVRVNFEVKRIGHEPESLSTKKDLAPSVKPEAIEDAR